MNRALVPVDLVDKLVNATVALANSAAGNERLRANEHFAAVRREMAGRVSRADVEAFTAALIRAWPEPFRGGHPGYTAIADAVRAGMAAIGLELETEC